MDLASYMTVSYMTDRAVYILVWTATELFQKNMAQKCVAKYKDNDDNNTFSSKPLYVLYCRFGHPTCFRQLKGYEV